MSFSIRTIRERLLMQTNKVLIKNKSHPEQKYKSRHEIIREMETYGAKDKQACREAVSRLIDDTELEFHQITIGLVRKVADLITNEAIRRCNIRGEIY